ncbi:unnamed protein product [Prorocentrum cordatum]|uniref:Uncharacterized protein n=1 Tax=Prorocentrum cordatum TaxID=2364126 RepID=A0ABN9W9G3_9DINO|nr:unnamed protein product [Polarella glacialis]
MSGGRQQSGRQDPQWGELRRDHVREEGELRARGTSEDGEHHPDCGRGDLHVIIERFLGIQSAGQAIYRSEEYRHLLKSNSAATEFGSMIQVYMDQKIPAAQEVRETRNFPKHPLDMSKDTFSFISFVFFMLPQPEDFASENPEDKVGKETLTALMELKSTAIPSLKLWVGEFSTRYIKPNEDFTWKWALTFSDFAPEVFRLAFSNLLFWKDIAKAVVIEQARSFQTPDEQRLWAALKGKPKPKGGAKEEEVMSSVLSPLTEAISLPVGGLKRWLLQRCEAMGLPKYIAVMILSDGREFAVLDGGEFFGTTF